MKSPVRVAVTGAAGQISYALLFRIASGDMLGHDQPVILQLLEIPAAMEALQGTVMEIEDGAFPLVYDVVASDKPEVAFVMRILQCSSALDHVAPVWNGKIF